MKNLFYFFKETVTLFKIEKLGNFFSVLSIALILTLLGTSVMGIFLGNVWIDILQREADIAVFTLEGNEEAVGRYLKDIKEITKLTEVSKEEAEKEMEDILGGEKTALKVLKENPFLPYFKVETELENRDKVLEFIKEIPGIDHIRDNKEAADKLGDIINVIKIISVGLIVVVGFVSGIVVSHIVRQDLTLHRSERTTLRLLGAGEGFLNTPYVLKALFLTLFAGILASIFLNLIIFLLYKNTAMGIIPLPPIENLKNKTITGIIFSSIILGVMGSFIPILSKGEKL